MKRKMIYLVSFALLVGMAGSSFAVNYNYQWTNNGNTGLWNQLVPTYNWQNNPSWQTPPVWTACLPPEALAGATNYAENITIAGNPTTRLMPVTIPAGYDVNLWPKAVSTGYQTIFGPEWGMKLDIYGKLGFKWTIAPVQGWQGLLDGSDPNDLVPPDDPNRSVINMYSGSEIYGPYLTGTTLGGHRSQVICLGLSWWFALPFVTMNMYGNSVAYTEALIIGGHLNMYGGTMDISEYVQVGTRDTYTVPDRLILIDIYEGTLILPANYSNAVQDWINRGILKAYGTTPNVPGGGTIIINNDINPGRTTVTALPANPPEASGPNPVDYATSVIRRPTLTWTAGRYAAEIDGHKLYFSGDYNDVNDRLVEPIILTDPIYAIPSPPGPLEYVKTYYWALDEVNDVNTWAGDVWRFTIREASLIDDFERYIDTGNVGIGIAPPAGTLRKTWIDGLWSATKIIPAPPPSQPQYKITSSASFVQINTDPCDGKPSRRQFNNSSIALLGEQSMKFYYENDGFWQWWIWLYGSDPVIYKYTAPMFSEVVAAIDDAARLNTTTQESLDMERDWSGYQLLMIPFYGDPNNTVLASDKLYVGLWDGDNNPASPVVIEHPDNTMLRKVGWENWYIPLSAFPAANANFSLTNVARIYLGVGNRTTPAAGGIGNLFFDEIQLLADGVCIPGNLAGDLNKDCTVNEEDLQLLTEVWLGQAPSLPQPVIDLDASGLSLGQVPQNFAWANTGTAGGSFKDFNSGTLGDNPNVAMVEGVKAVVFDGNDILMADFNAPDSITGSNPWTAIYKVWNLDIGVEEWVIMWAKRGGPAGTYAGVGYGTSPGWGVAAHWADPDMGFDRGVPAAHTWHTIAVTYPGGPNTVETILVDGVVNATEGPKTLNIYADCNMTVGAAYDGNSTVLPGNKLTPMFYLSGAVANVKIYNVYIPPKDLAILMDTPIDMKSDDVINFKDLAVLAVKWMVGPELFP